MYENEQAKRGQRNGRAVVYLRAITKFVIDPVLTSGI
jgi:hypothetical protein